MRLLTTISITFLPCHIMMYQDFDMPPTKRRRTLTDSLLTSALNVALISTAFGMSAYRMCVKVDCPGIPPAHLITAFRWRDGTEADDDTKISDEPPPYEEGDWVQVSPVFPILDECVTEFRRLDSLQQPHYPRKVLPLPEKTTTSSHTDGESKRRSSNHDIQHHHVANPLSWLLHDQHRPPHATHSPRGSSQPAPRTPQMTRVER